MEARIQYDFSGRLWKSEGQGGWHFVSLPKDTSQEIRANLQWQEEGWGRMKAMAKIEDVEWETAIWFDKKKDTYLLPVKAVIRKKIKLELNQVLELSISI